MLRHRPEIAAARRGVFALLPGDDPTAFDVAAVERVRREPLAVDIDMVILAAD
jgi:hypothetical protein